MTTSPRNDTLLRFDRTERILHWTNAVLFGVLLATAAALYIGPISAVVGRRDLVKNLHVYAGLALPVPLLLSFAGPRWGRRLRADLRRMNRWTADDRRWLRSRGRVGTARIGKFNAGQKLNAAFTGGAILVMLATGSIMRWPRPFRLSWRTGATFVHDWVAIGLFVSITAHLMFAFSDPEAMAGMVKGRVRRTWASDHHPVWHDEVVVPVPDEETANT